jgi:hypothetical protein
VYVWLFFDTLVAWSSGVVVPCPVGTIYIEFGDDASVWQMPTLASSGAVGTIMNGLYVLASSSATTATAVNTTDVSAQARYV